MFICSYIYIYIYTYCFLVNNYLEDQRPRKPRVRVHITMDLSFAIYMAAECKTTCFYDSAAYDSGFTLLCLCFIKVGAEGQDER